MRSDRYVFEHGSDIAWPQITNMIFLFSFRARARVDNDLQVTKERGEQLAVEYGIKFVETSAKASINVEEAFYTLASDIKAKMEKRLVRFVFRVCLIFL